MDASGSVIGPHRSQSIVLSSLTVRSTCGSALVTSTLGSGCIELPEGRHGSGYHELALRNLSLSASEWHRSWQAWADHAHLALYLLLKFRKRLDSLSKQSGALTWRSQGNLFMKIEP